MKVYFLLLCGLVLLVWACSPTFAYGPISHGNIVDRMMEDPDISYAVSLRGLSGSTISSEAALGDLYMPSNIHSNQWNNIRLVANLNASWMTWPLNNTYAGWLMHNIGDTSVPAVHSPANTWYTTGWAEALFEAQSEFYGMPGWPNPHYYTSNRDYNGYTVYFYNEMNSLANSFKSHNESYWPCKYFHVCQTDWIDDDCKRAALKLSWNVFYYYLINHP
ncbi:MAG: hypothetical protein GX629_05390 [Phycisphaerae bacterium]|nr:hypothetical protein [Phycisphaerae bacterium]